jgi:CRP-like cAMP-binding protein
MGRLNIEDIPVFRGLKQEEISKLLSRLKEHTFKSGEVLIREGEVEEEENRRMYIIGEGEVEVLKEDWAMNQKRVNILKDGDFFGEMSLIGNEPRSATVRALSEVTIYSSLSHSDLEQSLSSEGYTRVILNIGGEIAKRMEGTLTTIAELFKSSNLKLD